MTEIATLYDKEAAKDAVSNGRNAEDGLNEGRIAGGEPVTDATNEGLLELLELLRLKLDAVIKDPGEKREPYEGVPIGCEVCAREFPVLDRGMNKLAERLEPDGGVEMPGEVAIEMPDTLVGGEIIVRLGALGEFD